MREGRRTEEPGVEHGRTSSSAGPVDRDPQLKTRAPRCPYAHNISMKKRTIVAIKLPIKPAAANMVAGDLATPLSPSVFDGGSLDRFLASNRAVVPRELSRSRL